MQQSVQCPSCGAVNPVNAFARTTPPKMTFRDKVHRARSERRGLPLVGRPLGITVYDLVVTVGVGLFMMTIARVDVTLSFSGLLYVPFVYAGWRNADSARLFIESGAEVLRVRSRSLVWLQWCLYALSALLVIGINSSYANVLMQAIYVGWGVIMIQYLRSRQRLLAKYHRTRLRWYQRSEYMLSFGLTMLLLLIACDVDVSMSTHYSNRFIEALLS